MLPDPPAMDSTQAPPKRPAVMTAMLSAAVLSALCGLIGALMVFVGGKDLADENVRKAVDSNPTAVGLPSGTDSADVKRFSATMWDGIVTDWHGTMAARAAIAAVLAVAVLLFALCCHAGAMWARALLTVVALLAAAFPHALVLRDAAPAGLYATSLGAIVLAVVTAVLCWLPPVGRYKAAVQGR
nr:hypothetical protein [Streptomyces albus]